MRSRVLGTTFISKRRFVQYLGTTTTSYINSELFGVPNNYNKGTVSRMKKGGEAEGGEGICV